MFDDIIEALRQEADAREEREFINDKAAVLALYEEIFDSRCLNVKRVRQAMHYLLVENKCVEEATNVAEWNDLCLVHENELLTLKLKISNILSE